MSPADPAVLERLVNGSPLRVKYLKAPDRESAHEILSARIAAAKAAAAGDDPCRDRRGTEGTEAAALHGAEGTLEGVGEGHGTSGDRSRAEDGLLGGGSAHDRVLCGTLFGRK
jgi:hypothetical protein